MNKTPEEIEKDAIKYSYGYSDEHAHIAAMVYKDVYTQCQQHNAELNETIQDLLRFCETDGTLLNGFRTKEIILKLKTTITKQ